MVHIPRRTDMRVFMPFSSFPTLLLQLITNGFNILDAEMNSIATAIYLGVSITDHSCQPNAVATFEGNELHIHAIEDMECLDWSKIFISYIDLLNTPEQRRLDLKEHYYFLCVCTKCTDAKESKEMLAALCPNRNCGVGISVDRTNCPRCDAGISPKLRNAFNEAMTLTQHNLQNMKDVACGLIRPTIYCFDIFELHLLRRSRCVQGVPG